MKIRCDICGSNNFKKGENDFLCSNCGLSYSKEQIISMIQKVEEEEKKQKELEEKRIAEEKIRIAREKEEEKIRIAKEKELEEKRITEEKIRIAKEKEEEKIRIAREKEEEKIRIAKEKEEKRLQRKKDKDEEKISKEQKIKIFSIISTYLLTFSRILTCLLMIIITTTLINYSKRTPISFLKLGRKISTEKIIIDPSTELSDDLYDRFCPYFKLADCYEYYFNTTKEHEKVYNIKVAAQGLVAPYRYEPSIVPGEYIEYPEIVIANIKSRFLPTTYYRYSISGGNEYEFSATSVLGIMTKGYENGFGYRHKYNNSYLYSNPIMRNIMELNKVIGLYPQRPISENYIFFLPNNVSSYVVQNGQTFTSEIVKYKNYTRVKMSLGTLGDITLYINNETNELEYEELKDSTCHVIHKKSNKYQYLLKINEKMLKKYKEQIEKYNL